MVLNAENDAWQDDTNHQNWYNWQVSDSLVSSPGITKVEVNEDQDQPLSPFRLTDEINSNWYRFGDN